MRSSMEIIAASVEQVVHAMLLRVIMDTLHIGTPQGTLKVIWTMRPVDDS